MGFIELTPKRKAGTPAILSRSDEFL